jgi:hypothetical protein
MAKTKSTPFKKAKTANTVTIATTGTIETKKGGGHADNESFLDHFGNLCKYRGYHGLMKFSRTNTGKNQPLANCVHYTRKRKTLGILPDHHVDALHGINFEWKTGQRTRTKFEDFGLFGEDKKEYANKILAVHAFVRFMNTRTLLAAIPNGSNDLCIGWNVTSGCGGTMHPIGVVLVEHVILGSEPLLTIGALEASAMRVSGTCSHAVGILGPDQHDMVVETPTTEHVMDYMQLKEVRLGEERLLIFLFRAIGRGKST